MTPIDHHDQTALQAFRAEMRCLTRHDRKPKRGHRATHPRPNALQWAWRKLKGKP